MKSPGYHYGDDENSPRVSASSADWTNGAAIIGYFGILFAYMRRHARYYIKKA